MGRGETVEHHGLVIDTQREIVGRVVDESHAPGHAGGEVVADLAEDDGDAAGHVFAAVGAAALDPHPGAGVAHGEALSSESRRVGNECFRTWRSWGSQYH